MFDVEHRHAIERNTNEEDRAFLISQREDLLIFSMTGEDTVSSRLKKKAENGRSGSEAEAFCGDSEKDRHKCCSFKFGGIIVFVLSEENRRK